MAKKKRRRAQEATLRNVRASKRRDETLAGRLERLEAAQTETDRQVRELVHGMRSGLSKI